MKWLIIGLVVVVVVALIWVSYSTSRAGSESAPYRVLKSDGNFELREYPSLVVVQTPMYGADDSFMRLFRYIGGQNVETQKISMTTPVFMSGADTNATMAFVMPKSMSANTAPQPSNPDLAVNTIPAGQFAVFRFSGERSAQNETDALVKLREWMNRTKLSGSGEPLFGYFDPPWTPPALRRNEAMLRVASQDL